MYKKKTLLGGQSYLKQRSWPTLRSSGCAEVRGRRNIPARRAAEDATADDAKGEGAISANVTFLPGQQPRRTADDGKGDRADVTFLPALQQTTGRGKVRLCRRNIPNIPDETVRGTSPLGPALGAVIGRAVEAVNLHRHVEGWPNYSQGLVYYYMDGTRAKSSEDSVGLEILAGGLR